MRTSTATLFLYLNAFLIVFLTTGTSAFAGSPNKMTFQTKIVLPSGNALEAASVNFRFTVLDSAGTCILYVEDFNSINMTGTKGIVSFPLGGGAKQFPPSATLLSDVFNNSTTSFSCQAGGTSTPTATDNRQIVMQFNDGSGWQTLPQMAINAVPYANYATRAESLGDYTANAYLRPTTLPTCSGSQALNWNGTTFTCITAGGGGGGGANQTGVTSISNASGDITLAPVTTTGKVIVTSNTPSTGSSTGALVVQGGIGVTGAINSAGNITSSATVSAATSMYTPQLYGTSTPSGVIKIDGTSDATKGNVLLASAGGKVGIGTTTPPANALSVNGTANFSRLAVGTSSLGSDENIKFQTSTSTSNSLVANGQSILIANPAASGGGLIAHYNSFGAYTWFLSPNVNGGDMTGIIGGSVMSGGGSIVTATGVNGYTDNGGGTIAASRGGYFEVMNSGSGTNTVGYGVYIGNIVANSKYGLYQSDSTASNYFAGKISVGTTTSTYAMNVSGDVNVSGNFRVNGTVLSGGGGGGPTLSGITNISNASGDITLAPATGSGAVLINSGAASLGTSTGALVITGGAGISQNLNVGGNAVVAGSAAVAGNFGIGTISPSAVLHVVGPAATSGSAANAITAVGGAGAATNGNGGGFSFTGGVSSGAGTGGSFTVTGGNGSTSGYGGGINLTGGVELGSSESAAAITIAGGSGGTGPAIAITSGNGNGSFAGGSLNLTAGMGGVNGHSGGAVNITGGAGGGSTAGSTGGDVVINGGAKASTASDGNVLLATTRGNVGIGTTTPGNLLTIVKNQSPILELSETSGQSWDAGTISFTRTSHATGRTLGKIEFNSAAGIAGIYSYTDAGSNTGSDLAFNTDPVGVGGSQEVMRMTAAGNVGIGTTTPTSKLYVDVGGTNGGGIVVNGSDGPSLILTSPTGSFGTIGGAQGSGYFATSAQADDFVVKSEKRDLLLVAGSPMDAGEIRFIGGWGGFNERMRISNLGNVGIGTTTPSEKLSVTGNIAATGQVAGASQVISGGTTAIDWNNGNAIMTDYDCASSFQMANLRDGGSYTLVVTGTGTTQCNFSTTTTGTGAGTVTYRFKPANAARTASSYTVYTLLRVGSTVLVSWTSGF